VPRCSYNLQYAESDVDEVDEKGVASAQAILAAFDNFNWGGQVEAANHLKKCSPTFSIRDLDTDRLFWVSGCGSADDLCFMNEYTYQGEVRRLFGLSRVRGPVAAPTRELRLAEARRGVVLFLEGRHEELLELLAG
jgi:hypothetical protein